MDEMMITCLPNASSLIESMRSIGYSFETALADVIDNSISAGADTIQVFNRSKNGEAYIQILDNGNGMEYKDLIEAMRLGSKNPENERSETDLGRFGLGLKSASFSQCRLLTVISKKNKSISAFQWDLDAIALSNSFEIRQLSKLDIDKIPNVNDLKKMSSGTIVQWEKFDRISDSSSNVLDELSNLMFQAIEHISLIFHRFLNNDLNIEVNYEKVLPKEPFLKNHPGTQERKSKRVLIDGETINLFPYVLPHYSKLTAVDKQKIGKNNELYKSQGFYLYRNKRLIVWGDYLGLTKKTELSKNLRIQVDIPNTLDYLWEIDVKKSRAKVPSKIKKNLLSVINDGEQVSKRVSTHRGVRELTKEKPVWQFYSDRNQEFHFEINKENSIYKEFISSLNEQQIRLFNLFNRSIEDNLPIQKIYVEIAEGHEYKTVLDDDQVTKLIETLEAVRLIGSIDYVSFINALLSTEPYASNTTLSEILNREKDRNYV